jgi:C-terminal processing protease CtpA/Prc
MRFYAHLNDGHSGVFWPAEFDEALGYPAIEIRKVEGRAVVFRLLRPDDELAKNGIRPGVTILTIDGGSVEERLNYWRALKTASTPQATDRLAYFRLLTGPRNSTVDVVVQDPNGTPRPVRLTRSERYFNDTNLDPPQRQVMRTLGPGIGYFQANQMHQSVADAFSNFIENTTPLTGLILDLRYNGGGSDAAGFDIVSRLIDRPLDGPVYEVTSYQADRRAVREPPEVIRTQPKISPARGKRFTGPLVVLIGEQTHSAAESGFLSAIRARKESLLVGEPTAGSTGQPLVFPLAGGGIGAVCSRRSLASDGRPFVGIGFTPDIRIDLTSADLASGSDGALEKALAALRAGLSR